MPLTRRLFLASVAAAAASPAARAGADHPIAARLERELEASVTPWPSRLESSGTSSGASSGASSAAAPRAAPSAPREPPEPRRKPSEVTDAELLEALRAGAYHPAEGFNVGRLTAYRTQDAIAAD